MSDFQARLKRIDLENDIANSQQAAIFWLVIGIIAVAGAGGLCFLSPLLSPRAVALFVGGIAFAATAMHRAAILAYERRLEELG